MLATLARVGTAVLGLPSGSLAPAEKPQLILGGHDESLLGALIRKGFRPAVDGTEAVTCCKLSAGVRRFRP